MVLSLHTSNTQAFVCAQGFIFDHIRHAFCIGIVCFSLPFTVSALSFCSVSIRVPNTLIQPPIILELDHFDDQRSDSPTADIAATGFFACTVQVIGSVARFGQICRPHQRIGNARICDAIRGRRYCYARKDLTDTPQTCFQSLEVFLMAFFRAVDPFSLVSPGHRFTRTALLFLIVCPSSEFSPFFGAVPHFCSRATPLLLSFSQPLLRPPEVRSRLHNWHKQASNRTLPCRAMADPFHSTGPPGRIPHAECIWCPCSCTPQPRWG